MRLNNYLLNSIDLYTLCSWFFDTWVSSTSLNGVGLLEFGLALQMEEFFMLFVFIMWSPLSLNFSLLLHGKISLPYMVFKFWMSYF